MVVGEIAVVNQGLVHADEGMSPSRVPDPALGRITLVADPDVGGHLLDPIIPDHVLGVTDDLEDDQVAGVGEDEGVLFPQGSVIFIIDFK